MVKEGNWLVLDTETTGLGDEAQCIDIAIVAPDGTAVLNTLVRASIAIENAAAQAHGITEEMIEFAPSWAIVQPKIMEIIKGHNVITYGATFDRRILHQSDDGNGLPKVDYCQFSNWCCCMEAFAEVYGERNPRFGTYTWKKLVIAADYFDLGEFSAHRALSDTEMTRKVSLAIAQLWSVDNDGNVR